MPTNKIKELRQAGKLEEALNQAKAELASQPDNIWTKRNISWVYYDYLKQNTSPELFDSFLSWLSEIQNLHLPAEEKMLFDHLSWQIGAVVFKMAGNEPVPFDKIIQLLEIAKTFPYTKPSEGYSFIFKAFHKALKINDEYLEFADWWDFSNFRTEDFEKEKLPNGKEIIAIAEQGYIAYAKHLLPKQHHPGDIIFDKERALTFMPILLRIVEKYPGFTYPGYFYAKLLLAVGNKNDLLSTLLPFAKKKRNDFWVWEIVGEAVSDEPDKVLACYCKALSCISSEEMLVSLRQKMAGILIGRNLFNEAKTEIELLIKARNENGFKIPSEVSNWQTQEWYQQASSNNSNLEFYKEFIPSAESLLFSDITEELVVVEFVNSDKKILNFIASESKFGFFKYDRFIKNVKVGDTLKVRFQGGSNEGWYNIYTAIKVNDETFRRQFIKEVSGSIKIPEGKPFGFLEDVFIHPALVTRMKLTDGLRVNGLALKSYNQEKKQWGWKLIDLLTNK